LTVKSGSPPSGARSRGPAVKHTGSRSRATRASR
jgi:hypothetical protein